MNSLSFNPVNTKLVILLHHGPLNLKDKEQKESIKKKVTEKKDLPGL